METASDRPAWLAGVSAARLPCKRRRAFNWCSVNQVAVRRQFVRDPLFQLAEAKGGEIQFMCACQAAQGGLAQFVADLAQERTGGEDCQRPEMVQLGLLLEQVRQFAGELDVLVASRIQFAAAARVDEALKNHHGRAALLLQQPRPRRIGDQGPVGFHGTWGTGPNPVTIAPAQARGLTLVNCRRDADVLGAWRFAGFPAALPHGHDAVPTATLTAPGCARKAAWRTPGPPGR